MPAPPRQHHRLAAPDSGFRRAFLIFSPTPPTASTSSGSGWAPEVARRPRGAPRMTRGVGQGSRCSVGPGRWERPSFPSLSEKPRGFSPESVEMTISRETRLRLNLWRGGPDAQASSFIRGLFSCSPRQLRGRPGFSFVHHPLPEKRQLPPSLDTARPSGRRLRVLGFKAGPLCPTFVPYAQSGCFLK